MLIFDEDFGGHELLKQDELEASVDTRQAGGLGRNRLLAMTCPVSHLDTRIFADRSGSTTRIILV